jgi:hypothetical protein
LLIFESLSNKLAETEYELTLTIAKKPSKTEQKDSRTPRISVNGLPEYQMEVVGLDIKVCIG